MQNMYIYLASRLASPRATTAKGVFKGRPDLSNLAVKADVEFKGVPVLKRPSSWRNPKGSHNSQRVRDVLEQLVMNNPEPEEDHRKSQGVDGSGGSVLSFKGLKMDAHSVSSSMWTGSVAAALCLSAALQFRLSSFSSLTFSRALSIVNSSKSGR